MARCSRGILLAGLIAASSAVPTLSAGIFGDTIIDGTQVYSDSTSSGGSGTFLTDDTEILWQFSIVGQSVFTAYTSSFATGGFAPDLTLFYDDLTTGDPTGVFIAQGSEGSAPNCGSTQGVDQTTSSGYCLDSFLQQTLDTGHYLLVLTEDPNISYGDGAAYDSGNGFQLTGTGNFTGLDGLIGYAADNSQPNFWLFDNTPRNGNFVVNADVAALVPEPGTLFLLVLGLGACAGIHRQKLITKSDLKEGN